MTKADRSSKSRPKLPRGKRGKKAADETLNQATTDDFDQERMGVAPKE